MGGDLDPFAATGDYREDSTSRCNHPHIMLQLRHVFLGRGLFRERQIRAARSLIRWTADELAAASVLSVATVRRAELKESETALTAANDLAIRRALESAGVEFIDENGGGPGVRLRTGRK
jgi:hypothetical protein